MIFVGHISLSCTDYEWPERSCIQSYTVQKNSIPKLRQMIGGTKTKAYCQGTICRKFVLVALRTVKLGLTKVENQAYRLKYSEEKKKKYFVPI